MDVYVREYRNVFFVIVEVLRGNEMIFTTKTKTTVGEKSARVAMTQK